MTGVLVAAAFHPGCNQLSTAAGRELLVVQTASRCGESERDRRPLVESQVGRKFCRNLSRNDCVLLESGPAVVEEPLVKTDAETSLKSKDNDEGETTYTLSPTANSVTPSPTSFTTPEESVPSTAGKFSRKIP